MSRILQEPWLACQTESSRNSKKRQGKLALPKHKSRSNLSLVADILLAHASSGLFGHASRLLVVDVSFRLNRWGRKMHFLSVPAVRRASNYAKQQRDDG
jgi:hypothetical protein